MAVYDTRCNKNFDHRGMPKCHAGADDSLTQNGDTAVTSDVEEIMAQKILNWLSVARGERFDPKLGCILHEFKFEALTGSNLKTMAIKLRENLEYNLPEYNWSSVAIKRVTTDHDTEAMEILLVVSNKPLSFVVDAASLLEYSQASKKSLKNSGLLDISKTYGV